MRAVAGDLFWNDSWDGYPAARARIIQHIHSRKIASPVVLTGDWHAVESGRPGVAQA